MKKDNLKKELRKKEAYQKPEIKSESFELAVYGTYFSQVDAGECKIAYKIACPFLANNED